jgi:hypothetical protein
MALGAWSIASIVDRLFTEATRAGSVQRIARFCCSARARENRHEAIAAQEQFNCIATT